MFKWIAEKYIKKCVQDAVRNGNVRNLQEIHTVMFTEARVADTESNDSTIYVWMLDQFNVGSKALPDVAEVLRKWD